VRRVYLGNFVVDSRMILKLTLVELVLRFLTGSLWLGMLVPSRHCDRIVYMFPLSDEPSGIYRQG
jgi:hypothetical protein